MGLAERDYYRQSPPSNPLGIIRNWSVTSWLIAINIAVFIVDNISHHQLAEWGYFSETTAISELQLWRFFTFQFLHHDTQHIFQNMIALYFIGQSVEPVLRARKYLAFYFLCGFAGPLMCMLFAALQLLRVGPDTPMVGASAGIMGVIVAAAVLAPNMRIMFDFILPMKMRTFALILLGLAILEIGFSGVNAGGEAAHLGGAAAGFLLIKNPQLLNFVNYRRGPRMRYRP
jgi:membrane associated rhomboid family serine protease